MMGGSVYVFVHISSRSVIAFAKSSDVSEHFLGGLIEECWGRGRRRSQDCDRRVCDGTAEVESTFGEESGLSNDDVDLDE